MPSLPNWIAGRAASEPVPGSTPLPPSTYYPRIKDPNAPDRRLQITSRCIYERQLPGGSYITAHVERLQSGYYDSPGIHDDCIRNVRFVAIRFVFHEASTERRFKSASIRLSVHDANQQHAGIAPLPPQVRHPSNEHPPPDPVREGPKFLRHAPHLLYGAMSPENLDWNFNLAGSLGVAQTPVSASINPSGGVKSSYKVYKMMKIQGSIRTNASWFGKDYDVEDGELVWTLEENSLQKSGLPREFTFVMMLTKGDDGNDVQFEIDIQPEVASWFGHYPQWWVHILRYQPLYKDPLNLDHEIGQRFTPCDPVTGFNFAALMGTFDDFVTLPGTLYSTNDWSADKGNPPPTQQSADASKQQQQQQQQKQSSTQASALTQSPKPVDEDKEGNPNNTLHLRIHLDQPSHKLGMSIAPKVQSPEPLQPSRSKRSSQPPTTTISPPTSANIKPSTSANAKPDASSKSSNREVSTRAPAAKSTKPSSRVTINGTPTSTPPNYKVSRPTPLQTHFEEPTHRTTQELSAEKDEPNQDYYSFPQSSRTILAPVIPHPLKPSSQRQSQPHAHNKSASTTSPFPNSTHHHHHHHHSANPPTTSPTAHTALTSHPSLRRTHSRNSLRKASLHSSPEDEEAISAAMDMLSGSPPPAAPDAPPSRSAPSIPADDIVLATPRTRATLADMIEVERAEQARVARRNGNLNSQMAMRGREHSAGPSLGGGAGAVGGTPKASSRSRERERAREKRYSMPVTSTGIGYPGVGAVKSPANVNGAENEMGEADGNAAAAPRRRSDAATKRSDGGRLPAGGGNVGGNGNGIVMGGGGNGRSSLMIPVGTRRDHGLGIGVASTAAER